MVESRGDGCQTGPMRSPPDPSALMATVAAWRARERRRPPAAEIVRPGPGQDSVWDYPRPPRVAAEPRLVQVVFAGRTIVETRLAKRVVETSGAPVYYVPLADVADGVLAPTPDWSICEWKGIARYFDVTVAARTAERAAWHYPDPLDDLGQGYTALRDHVAFYAGAMDACLVGGERVRPQSGNYYGGWVTSDVVGPFKGGAGSEDW